MSAETLFIGFFWIEAVLASLIVTAGLVRDRRARSRRRLQATMVSAREPPGAFRAYATAVPLEAAIAEGALLLGAASPAEAWLIRWGALFRGPLALLLVGVGFVHVGAYAWLAGGAWGIVGPALAVFGLQVVGAGLKEFEPQSGEAAVALPGNTSKAAQALARSLRETAVTEARLLRAIRGLEPDDEGADKTKPARVKRPPESDPR